jgi:[ribosomal protein S18]-alanine N-acetyltransferase
MYSSKFETKGVFPAYLSPRFVPMTVEDLDAIMEIERHSFPSPWTIEAYRRELRRNMYGSYWVVRPGVVVAGERKVPVLAYGGMWLMGEDAHITTIATHPDWRRCKLGEWLLLRMLGAARTRGAEMATLEVRVSNLPAIALYEKLGFEEVGLRKGYYHDSGEDALLYTLFRLKDKDIWDGLQRELKRIEGET